MFFVCPEYSTLGDGEEEILSQIINQDTVVEVMFTSEATSNTIHTFTTEVLINFRFSEIRTVNGNK